ncbi:MAG: hypothetical protein U9R75_10095 [Candidatus Thermoplasmatota archaeon]|nr:hypothetical protein [Candidatus Thermoplasmatota archaeon]
MRNRYLIMVLLVLLAGKAGGELSVSFEEDTFAIYDAAEIFPDDVPGNLTITSDDGLQVYHQRDGKLNITSDDNWNGVSSISISNGTKTIIVDVNVLPVNDAPIITGVIGPDNLTGAVNPLNMSVEVEDVDDDELTVEWFVGNRPVEPEDEPVTTGRYFNWYVYPGNKFVTVKVSDPYGADVTMEFEVSMKAPPGAEDGPDNTWNRIIFWMIFGSGGLIFGLCALWVIVKKDVNPPVDKN